MRGYRRTVLIMAAKYVALLAAVIVGSLVALLPGAKEAAATSSNSGCLPVLSDGSLQLLWQGEPTQEADRLANDLQTIVEDHPDELTGVSFCTDYGKVLVTAPDITGSAMKLVRERGAKTPNVGVEIGSAAKSLAELRRVSNNVAQEAKKAKVNVTVGPDIYTGGLNLAVQTNSDAEAEDIRNSKGAKVERIRAAIPSDIPVKFKPSRQSYDQTRAADISPYYMGAELIYSWNGQNWACSLGVPITISGKKLALTAGHCVGSSFSNNGNVVGTQYTTAYPGNSYLYGDWKLIQGSSYGMAVFNGGLSSNSALPITGGNYVGRPNGSGVCTSGRTTAQICRYVVIGIYRTESIDGVTNAHMLETQKDADSNGYGEETGSQGGDSGGPCYYGNGSTGVIVTGIVKGKINWWGTNGWSYYCTQLSGLRQWAPTAVVG